MLRAENSAGWSDSESVTTTTACEGDCCYSKFDIKETVCDVNLEWHTYRVLYLLYWSIF